jgi:hypothetical protein
VEALRATAYGEIAAAHIAAGDPARARDAARLAIAAAEAAGEGEERMFAELAAAVAQVHAGYPEDARRRAGSLPGEEERVAVLAGLASALMDAGFGDLARLSAVEAARGAAILEPGEPGNFTVMAILARSASGAIDGLPAEVAAIGDDDKRNGLLVLIAEDQAVAGDFTGAMSTAALIGDGPKTAESDTYLAGRILRAVSGDSLAVARDIAFDARVPARIVALNRIAVLQARRRDPRGAAKTFTLAVEHARSAYAGTMRAQALTATAMAQAAAGDGAGALETLRSAEAVLEGQTGEEEWEAGRAATVALAVRDAIEGGKAAESTIGQPEYAGDPNELLVMKALALVRLGRTVAARDTLEFAARNSSRDSDLSITAAAYAMLTAKQVEWGDAAGAGLSANRALLIADGLSVTSEDRVIAMFFAAVALARAGELDLAEKTAARIELQTPEPVQ